MNVSTQSNRWAGHLQEWLHTPVIPVALAKEIRTALPFWAASWFLPCLALIWMANVPEDASAWMGSSLFALCAAALGASVFGSEFQHQTLPMLLAQPVSRRRLWVRKMVVLMAALLTSGVVIMFCVRYFRQLVWTLNNDLVEIRQAPALTDQLTFGCLIAAAALVAFCLGPWLALEARSSLAGAVFTLAVPTLVWLGTNWCAGWVAGSDPAFRLVCSLVVLAVTCGAGLILGYQRFLRLEVVDQSELELAFPKWLAFRKGQRGAIPVQSEQADQSSTNAATKVASQAGLKVLPRNHGWASQLIWKELRLHQMTLVLAGLFCAASLVYAVLPPPNFSPEMGSFAPFFVLIYSVMLSVLAGSLTSAEERQLGMLEWQLTFPLRARTQWLIKVAVALSVSLVLAALLPTLLFHLPALRKLEQSLPPALTGLPFFAGLSLVVTSWAIYASSLSTSTVRAILLALVLALAYWIFVSSSVFFLTVRTISTLCVIGLLWFAFTNFRWVGSKAPRVLIQAAVALCCVLLVYVLAFGI
jgi:hypothetical protein